MERRKAGRKEGRNKGGSEEWKEGRNEEGENRRKVG